jgi:hypothetical protein
MDHHEQLVLVRTEPDEYGTKEGATGKIEPSLDLLLDSLSYNLSSVCLRYGLKVNDVKSNRSRSCYPLYGFPVLV